GSLEGWAEGLHAAGVQINEAFESRPDLAIAPARNAASAAAAGAAMVLLEGRGARPILAKSFPVVERFLPIPSLDAAELILPLAHPRASQYAINNWSLALNLRRRVRNGVARTLLTRRMLPELRPILTVGTTERIDPF